MYQNISNFDAATLYICNIFLIKTETYLRLSLLSVPGGGRRTKADCDQSEPAAAHPPGARHAALRGPPAPPDRTDNLLARQHRQPGPLSGLVFGETQQT